MRSCEVPDENGGLCANSDGVKAVRDPGGDLLDMCRHCRAEWPVDEVLEADGGRVSEWVWASTISGGKLHAVDMASESMLALGTDGADNHQAACGTCTQEWTNRSDSPMDPDVVCISCAEQLLDHYATLDLDDLGVDTDFLQRATGEPVLATDGGGYEYVSVIEVVGDGGKIKLGKMDREGTLLKDPDTDPVRREYRRQGVWKLPEGVSTNEEWVEWWSTEWEKDTDERHDLFSAVVERYDIADENQGVSRYDDAAAEEVEA